MHRLNAIVIALALALAGCLSDALDEAPGYGQCAATDDCASGEVCIEGLCYGNPPEGIQLAAVLEPPAAGDGPVLVPTEITGLEISPDGEITNLVFSDTVTISGEVVLACDPANPDQPCGPIEATIEARRPSAIPGRGPLIRQTMATLGPNQETPRFSLSLPPSRCEDPDRCEDAYVVTVTPASEAVMTFGESGIAPAQLAPPQSFLIVAKENDTLDLVVGEPDNLKSVTGCIQYGGGLPGVPGYGVTALGQLDGVAEPVRASTRAVTDADGCFTLRLPKDLSDEFDFVFAPDVPTETLLPDVRVHDIVVPDSFPDPVFTIEPAFALPDLSGTVEVTVPITAISSGGEAEPVPGAEVLFFTQFEDGDPTREMTVTFQTRALTGVNANNPGHASARLFPGNRIYDVVVLPPSDSEFASVFNAQVAVGSSGGIVQGIQLERRHALQGTLVNVDGLPIASAPVSARPSASFLYDFEREQGGDMPLGVVISELDFPVLTGEDGRLFVWLDEEISGATATYDITVEPPVLADAPTWTFEAVAPNTAFKDLGELETPRASYAWGVVRDARGRAVAGATLQIYQIRDASAVCADECSPPPYLRGVFQSLEDGRVMPVVLPAP